jgi:nucleoside-diphosphate-sugar epimerase
MLKASKDLEILVAGAGGFIGGWVVKSLLEQQFVNITAVDIKPLDRWHQLHVKAKNFESDLKLLENARNFTKSKDLVINLAADMGGMGFIENNKTSCMLSVLINTHLLQASEENSVSQFFFSSSACVYNASKQDNPNNLGLREADAYPAMPEDGYGWEKLFSERMCRHFREEKGILTTVARFHNVYGPLGTFDGGREKAPAALSRKMAIAKISGKHEIDIWGDGEQTRSFTYIDDTVDGIFRIIDRNIEFPINLGSTELVSINQMVSILEEISGINVTRTYNLNAPKGVRGRNSENSLILKELGWEPTIKLAEGLQKTYQWIFDQISK